MTIHPYGIADSTLGTFTLKILNERDREGMFRSGLFTVRSWRGNMAGSAGGWRRLPAIARGFVSLWLLAFGLVAHAEPGQLQAPQSKTDLSPPSTATQEIIAERLHRQRLYRSLPQYRTRLLDLLERMVAHLEKRLESGPPFLQEERHGRLHRLKSVFRSADVDAAEKLRRVFEAYRVELDYGKTIEAYLETIHRDGRERLAELLRIGSLALFYRTLDGTESGIWSAADRRWHSLPASYDRDIVRGVATARKLDPPQLLTLPLPGPKAFEVQFSDAKPAAAAEVKPFDAGREAGSADFLESGPTDSEFAGALAPWEDLFATVRENAAALQPHYGQSLAAVHAVEQRKLVDRLASPAHIPTPDELEELFLSLRSQLEVLESIGRFEVPVYAPNGRIGTRDVVRIGGFSMISDGRYLARVSQGDALRELPRQPPSGVLAMAQRFQRVAANAIAPVAIDPTGGQVLELLVRVPSLVERIAQGGVIGYVILSLGALACLLALVRFVSLSLAERNIGRQLRLDAPDRSNPLGRVLSELRTLAAAEASPDAVSLRFEQALVTEVARLERWLPMLRLLAAIAPMLGLLGTVTGMIQTFQTIALHGSGDPKLMSGGISQALVTTVEGLVMAIPIMLLHTLLAAKSGRLVTLLTAHSAAAMATHLESGQHPEPWTGASRGS